MASAFKKVKKKLTGKGKGKRRGDDTQEGEESGSLPDVVREAHNENAPICQPSTSSQKSSVGSKKNDLKSAGGSLDSELCELNLQDVFDKKFPKASQGGVAAATATAQRCGNNHQGASGVSSKPPNPNSGSSRYGITHSEETHTQVSNVPEPANTDGGVIIVTNCEASGDGLTHSEQTHTQVLNWPGPANTDGGVITVPNSEASGDDPTHNEQTHIQELNVPEPANTDGGVVTVPNSDASGDGLTHSEQTRTQVPNVPEPANSDRGIPIDLNYSETSRGGVTDSQQTHSQVLNVPDPVNADELVNPDSGNEASRDDHNQERNAATAGRTEVPEATVPVAAAATATAAPTQPDESNLQSLTNTPIQEEAVGTVDNGCATSNQTPPSEEAANRYESLYVSDVIASSNFLEDKLARGLDHTSHRVIKTWEHLACTKEVNAPLEMRLRCKLNSENSCTQMLIDFLTVEMEDKTVHDLIEALRGINRHDVVRIITDVYSDAENSTEKISEFASSNANSEIIKEMATKLDQIKSRVLKNWMDLGRQFKISGDKLKEIEYGQFNPALVLMEYLYSEQEHLTVGKFYEEVKNLKRGDVLKKLDPFLSEHSEEPMKDVIQLDDDVMTSICVCLNNPNRALKNWRHLACAFKVPREIYKDFNPEKPMSATSELFKWMSANRRELTVGQLCAALKSIERNDVVRDLRNYFQEQQSTGQE